MKTIGTYLLIILLRFYIFIIAKQLLNKNEMLFV